MSPRRLYAKLSDITVWIDMKGTQLDERQQSDLLQYVERCKVLNTLRANSIIKKIIGQRERGGRVARPASK